MNGLIDGHLVLIQATFVNLLLALSLQVPLRAGVFSFAGVGAYGMGCYLTAIVSIRWGWAAFPCIAVSIVVSSVVALALAGVLRRLSGLYLGMATISFDLILGVLVVNGGDLTGGPQGLFGVPAELGLSAIVAVCAVVVALVALTERGRARRVIEAVRHDPQMSLSVGIRVPRVRLLVFVASAAIGSCAGAVNVVTRTTISPDDIGFSLVVLALTMIVVGGSGSWVGALIGAVTFTWLPSTLQFVGEWQAVVYGCIVAIAAVWLPGGLVGLVASARRGVVAGRRGSEPAFADESRTPTPETTGVAP